MTRSQKHARMMIGLGFKGGIRNYATYIKRRNTSNAWNKAHRYRMRLGDNRYYQKIVDKYGVGSEFNFNLYVNEQATTKLKKRKERANEARKELLRLQRLLPNRRGRGSASPLTI